MEAAVSLISHLAPDQACAEALRLDMGVELLLVLLNEHEDLIVSRK